MGKAAQRKGGDGARVIVLPADFRLGAVAGVKADLVEALEAAGAQLDGGAVERVDTAALQLLLAYRREAAARGLSPAWRGVSEVMRDAAGVLGLARDLELPANMPA